jgi:hypothetical protein
VVKDNPPQQNTNTLYVSKVPAEATGEPLKLLIVLGFPEDLFANPHIQVRNGPFGSYFIRGPSDDPEWANTVMGHKPQSEIRHTQVHLGLARRRFQRTLRPPSEEQVSKREEVAQKMRQRFGQKEPEVSTSTSTSTTSKKRPVNPTTPGPHASKRSGDRQTPGASMEVADPFFDIDDAEASSAEDGEGNKQKVH